LRGRPDAKITNLTLELSDWRRTHMTTQSRFFLLLFVVIATLSILPAPAHAKSDAKEVIGELIRKGEVKKAREKVHEYLAKDPNDIDAIMMQGNVILNEYEGSNSGISVSANTDESIYETSIGFITEPQRIVPRNVAEEVAALWKRCLALDNTRQDIHKGICYLYSTALMKKELLERLPKMKAAFPRSEVYYNMGDYARMFADRDRLDDCFEIYETILRLYPEVSGLYSDIAGLYFKHGRIADGRRYIETALTKKGADEMVYANARLICTIKKDYDKALNAAKGLSRIKKNQDWLLYAGLLDDLRGGKGMRKTLASLAGKDSEAGKLADFLISPDNKGDIESYRKAVNLAKDSSIQLLMHDRARNRFPTHFEPHYRYAEMLVYYKDYSDAIPVFEKIFSSNLKMSSDEQETVHFHYAWALQDSGKGRDADQTWKGLLTSKNFYVRSAAAYFLGKNALEQGKKKDAVAYFKMVSDKASKSKYATLCWNKLKVLE
jgi:tetratricopeptide (TPR) repeat protein